MRKMKSPLLSLCVAVCCWMGAMAQESGAPTPAPDAKKQRAKRPPRP